MMKKRLSSPARVSKVHKEILRWYADSARPLPWRGTNNAYRILISEVMLQQTQVSRVLVKYPEFLRRFPRLEALARADATSVLRAWQGMGYNSRALRLRQLAQELIRDNKGTFPTSITELQSLPGIGRYTSRAIACFAFGQQVPVVDTNIRRVLSRIFPGTNRKDPWALAADVLPRTKAYAWNQALMDLGSTICTSASPRCGECPVGGICPSAFRVRRRPRVPSNEPRRDGIPNRIYRGRVVEALRSTKKGESIRSHRLARLVKPGYSSQDRLWFRKLLNGLRRDGLISIRGDSVSFPP